MTDPARPRSPLGLIVLAFLLEEPMHPYRIQVLIKERGKDLVANVAQRNSVYQTIDALERAGLVEVHDVGRDENRPERTVYAATAAGRRTLMEWLRTVLSTPAREFPDFPAALSLAMMLAPAALRTELEARLERLEARRKELSAPMPLKLPRIFLLETEYMAEMLRAEAAWLRRVIADLGTKKLTWSEAELRRLAAKMRPPEAAPPPPRRRGARRQG